jgi:hypothetical protein
MSRWLWALLGGVVVLAIAAVLWTSNQTAVMSPVSQAPAPIAPAPLPPPPAAPASVAAKPPSPAPAPAPQQPSPAPPTKQEAATSPTPTPAPAPAPTQDAAQQADSRTAPAPPAEKPVAPPVVAQEPPPPPAPAPLAETPPSPAPGGEEPEAQGHYAPKSLAQLVGAWAYSAEDCDKVFQRRGGGWAYRQPVDKFAQAAIVESKRVLLPSATCQIDGASQVDGALKVTAECASSISFTSRSTVIMLRSPTELVYSANGDPVLATTLKKCAT